MTRPCLGILISGRGSNMQAFIDACNGGSLHARVGIVISNRPDAPGLQLAAQAGIATTCIDHRDYESREAFDAALVHALDEHDVDAVILAGFMRILTPVFIEPYYGRLFNIHPSLLPKYPGLNTHQRALDAGDECGGTTVHFVTPELDGGPPVLQAKVAIEGGDSAEALAARVQVLEHLIYPLAVKWFLEKRLQLRADGAYLDGELLPESGADFTTS